MPKAKKLPSGSWRCQVYDYTDQNNKRHYKSFTSDDPTSAGRRKAEMMAAQYAIEKKQQNKSNNYDMTVSESVTKFIESKESSLSPTTITAYRSMQKNLMNNIGEYKIKDLDSAAIQKWIGTISRNHKPKTVKNAYGLLNAMIDTLYPNINFRVKLPQKERKNPYVPTDSDVQVLIAYFQKNDIDMLIACSLAAFGTLRRSEICALTADDVHGNIISVNKAVVKKGATDDIWITKATKNTSSTREVEMPKFVIDILPSEGALVKINPSRVSDRFAKALKKMNIEHFRFHDLRHYSASIMHALGVPDVYIMERGGWSSDATLKQIYRGSMDDYERKFTDITINHFENMQHEMQHGE